MQPLTSADTSAHSVDSTFRGPAPGSAELGSRGRPRLRRSLFLAGIPRDIAEFVGRPSPLYHAQRFPASATTVLFKREDLNHTGAHKINNAVGQGLLARRMGMQRLIAETCRQHGWRRHGLAPSWACGRVFMGELDIRRQAMNVPL